MPHLSASIRLALAALVATSLSFGGCGEDSVEAPRNLYLRVSSGATRDNQAVGSLRILLTKGDAYYPVDAAMPAFNPDLGSLDIRNEPLLLSVSYAGATFGDGDAVTVEVMGLGATDGTFVARGEVNVDLGFIGYVDVKLSSVPTGCDTDGDGFLDCTVAGCCAPASPFADCEPDDASANPWGTEAACEPCSDTIDQDCRGGDQACVDADNDSIADCSETTCGAGDGAVGPGLPEICDDKDNDCDGSTDEGFTLTVGDETLPLGATCGVGACAGGSVVCDNEGGTRCSGDDNRALAEICNNDIDDDCDGDTDEECPLLDADEDTFTTEQGDCDDNDNTVYPGADEICDGKDNDCNESTDEGFDDLDDDDVADCVDPDIDGDEVNNEDDNCPLVANAGQADADGDGLGDACDQCTDSDGDGWGRAGTDLSLCEKAGVADCDDTAGNVADVDADNVCTPNDNCPNVANPAQTNTDGDASGDACDTCIDVDGDGWGRGINTAQCPSGPREDCDDRAGNNSDVDRDNACDSNDNCVGTANPDQADLDNDDVGDACDPCVDVDGDGWGRSGTNRELCDFGAALDCDDSPGNTADPDRDNACGSDDNCPNVDNVDQTNTDGDAFGDACDACIDVDGDGFGRGGLDLTQCPGGSAVDCNDLANNTDDPDADNLCGAADNCPNNANADQADLDGDDNGDACDPCVDVDGDGFGRSGLDMDSCPKGPAVDCNDNAGNTEDGDGDNACGDADNCPATANADQADLDGDGLGDVCDPCTDSDDDGYGVAGSNRSQCARGTAVDCNDAADNTDDPDGDNICAPDDNCANVANVDQQNTDGDAFGDACDVCIDVDGDGFGRGGVDMTQCAGGAAVDCNDQQGNTDDVDGDNACLPDDNCPAVANVDQVDADADDVGDACDPCVDADGDGYGRSGLDMDACPNGPAVDCNDDTGNTEDVDADNICGDADNCPGAANPGQADLDGDGLGDVCDPCTDSDNDGYGVAGSDRSQCAGGTAEDCNDATGNTDDPDGDNVCAPDDNCATVSNADQQNTDGDAFGDACDVCIDVDGDGFGRGGVDMTQCAGGVAIDCNDQAGNADDADGDNACSPDDNCPAVANADQFDADGDDVGDACDACVDADGDGYGRGGTDVTQCPMGSDLDCNDAVGNVDDVDADNVCGDDDNCPAVANADQANTDGDANGDACDACVDVDGDGWGRGGLNPASCPNGATVDCDDTVGNTVDNDEDNVCGAADNCPDVANAAQTNADSDALGDACDPCVDGDGDGWGRGGTDMTQCPNGDTLDCNDTVGNPWDPDRDNFCSGDDNCPSVANPSQANTDGDAFGDACDVCVDVDDDGFGRGGLDMAQCPGGPDLDCDDTFGNEVDPDADNVCDPDDNCPLDANADQADEDDNGIGDICDFTCPGDADNDGVCDSGRGVKCDATNTRTCDDNCLGVANPLQYDTDDDGFGDACDEPLEVCTDCIDNDNDVLTLDAGACSYRRYVAFGALSEDVPVGHPLSLVFDHAFLVTAGRSTASGDDIRVFYVNPTTKVWEELDRWIDPDPGPNNAYTKVWFASQAAIDAGNLDMNYRLIYTSTPPVGFFPPADGAAIFRVWDDFDRAASATVGGDWSELETAEATVSIVNNSIQADVGAPDGAMEVLSANTALRPVATLPFDAIDSGLHVWRIGWNFVNEAEGNYSLVMQLGDSTHTDWNASPADMAQALGGSGPTLIWAGSQFGTGNGANLLFGYPASGTNVNIRTQNAPEDLYVVVDADNGQFVVFPNANNDAWIPFRNTVDQLDRLRIFTDGLNTDNFSTTQFEYLGVHDFLPNGEEPYGFLGLKEPMACTTVGTPVARYYLDDATSATTLSDSSSGAAANLAVTTASVLNGAATQPYIGPIGTLGGLTWFTNRQGGRADAFISGAGADAGGAKITAAMDETLTGTLEIVVEPYEVPASNQTVTFVSIQEGNNKRFSLSMRGNATAGGPAQVVFYGENNIRGIWNVDVVATRRVVLHGVYNVANNPDFQLYRDGVLLTPVSTSDMGDLDITNNNALYLGNVPNLNESPRGFIYYVAMYASALTNTQVRSNWRVLEADDDTPAP